MSHVLIMTTGRSVVQEYRAAWASWRLTMASLSGSTAVRYARSTSLCIKCSVPFIANYGGRCPIGPDGIHRIQAGDMIIKLEKPLRWSEERVTRYGRPYVMEHHTDFVHEECWERYQNDKSNETE